MKKLTEAQIGYIAAMLDGEGQTTCVPVSDKWHKAPYVACRVTIHSSCREMLDRLQSWTGVGNVHERPHHQKWLPAWALNIRRLEDVASLLDAVIPFLIIKRERAILVRQYVESRLIRKRQPLNAEELAISKRVTAINTVNRPEQYGKWIKVNLRNGERLFRAPG